MTVLSAVRCPMLTIVWVAVHQFTFGELIPSHPIPFCCTFWTVVALMAERASKKSRACNEEMDPEDVNGEMELSYVEFYSGVGGWTMALEEAIRLIPETKLRLRRIAALDHSDLCTKVFEHNFGSDKKSFAIERLTLEQVEEWNATIWAMSPPCQPHTRQHSNQAEDLNDPRSSSFLHLVKLIKLMKKECLPPLIFLENVVGFESSSSFDFWIDALEGRGYKVSSFHLNPTQIGLPNDRPRYYGVAVRNQHSQDPSSDMDSLHLYFHPQPKRILKCIPELGVKPDNETPDLPTISIFLDKNTCPDNIGLSVPTKVLTSSAAWCFDVVTPASRRSSCFTQSYGRYIRGTGSILYQDQSHEIHLLPPEDRKFDEEWAKDLDLAKLRYFSGSEMARLMGFSKKFSFPSNYTNKQQWKLIGNSLNVQVASKIIELGLRLMIKR